ncbi:DNA primase [Microlunatus panaciterrae]|uniref:DNA primase n=1 Tax=Microlunatus panaciterrae TaxID=400768 RepID=A0ABS2RFH9_9ACTN|nr:DNA primase [Microlunatus panaciterrae]
MAGRINDDDIAAVRDRAKVEEIVGSYVSLRRSGGSMVGLCPFHDEKTPSFNVNPTRGYYHCFGCGEGGDVIAFVQKIESLTFVEAIERLADRVGIQLRYTEEFGPRPEPGQRMRLLEAHRLAAEFFVEQLTTPDALTARQFLAQRGFDREAAERFGVGFAPRGGRELLQHLRARGFRDTELVTGGLIREAGYDFFRGRLLWPIRDTGKSVVGFGARRIFDDDRVAAKYLNTPETPLYKKSQVLYGLDLARQQIAKKSQAVIVEGYTDVMAAHLSGVDTAVASCGTAFGDDHARLLRRLMGNHDAFHGEVIFTFDGDAAGQAAAIKVFNGDQNFVTQTYVAVEPTGLDPCDLRLQHGEAAVRELVARRVPLYRFVMTNILQQHDLDRADGRLAALREAAPLVASIRDTSMVSGYARELAGLLGMDPEEVRREVLRTASRGGGNSQPDPAPSPTRQDRTPSLPDPRDRSLSVERETAKLLVQHPGLFGDGWDGISEADFTHPAYAAVFGRVAKAGALVGTATGGDWVQQLQGIDPDPQVSSLVVELAVEPVYLQGQVTTRYVVAYSAKLQLLSAMRRIAELKSKLQRTNPVEEPTRYNQMFSELVVLESTRSKLQTRSLGALD